MSSYNVTTDATERMFTVRELAKTAKVSEITLRRATAAGLLACFRIGRCVRISERQWLDYRSRRERKA
jgi:excisionase family DNA binding protein